MKNKIPQISFLLLYIAMFAASVISVISFEVSVHSEREALKEPAQVTVDLEVASIPDVSDKGMGFCASTDDEIPTDNLLYVYIQNANNTTLYPGDRIRVTGELSVPQKALNPYGYDYSKTVKSMGSSLVLYTDIKKVSNRRPTYFEGIYSMRDKVSDNMYRYMENKEAALCDAIVTGNRDNIDPGMTQAYKKAGIYHIVAVSGLHLGMILIFIAVAYNSSRNRFRKRSVLKFIFTLLASVFLLIFTGSGVSVWRCSLMAVMMASAMVMTREYSPFAALYIIANMLIITKPSLYLSPAMQLSFAATLGILCGGAFLSKAKSYRWKFRYILETFVLCQFTFVFTLPVMAYTFGGVSVAGIVCNIIVLAMAPFLLGFAYIYSIVSLFAPDILCMVISDILSVIALGVNNIAELFAKLPFSYVKITFPTFLILMAEASAMVIIYELRKNSKAMISAILVFALANIIPLAYNGTVDKVTVTFINAGQGDCTLIQDSKGGTFMIDCGSSSHSSIGTSEILPYLRETDAKKIDILFITHYHADHISGIEALMEEDMVKKLVVPKRKLCPDETAICVEIMGLAEKYDIEVEYASRGDVIKHNHRNSFYILNPQAKTCSDANDGSMVVEYRHKDKKVLLCADITEDGQRAVADTISDCDIIKIAHHGGYCGTSFMTASRANAEYAVISCGKGNSFNHPSSATVAAYSDSEIYLTENGPVIFDIEKGKIKVR